MNICDVKVCPLLRVFSPLLGVSFIMGLSFSSIDALLATECNVLWYGQHLLLTFLFNKVGLLCSLVIDCDQ